jgi:membrane-bound serine protease (ClpP class)
MHGALAFLVGISVTLGALLLFAAFTGVNLNGTDISVILAAAAVAFALAVIAAYMLYKGLEANLSKVKTGKEALMGAKGVAVTDVDPNGEIRVLGEFWQALTKQSPIPAGQIVQVVDMEGMFLVVQPAEEKLNSQSKPIA